MTTAGAIIIAGVAAAAGAVASGAMASNAQDEANQTNKDMQEAEHAYQTSERLATQEYNTPEAQRQRYEQAGINPYLAMGNLEAGNTSAQTGIQPPKIQPNLGFSDMMQNLLGDVPSRVLQYQQQAEQITGMQEANYQAHVESINKERQVYLDNTNKAAEISSKLSQIDKNSAEAANLRTQLRTIEYQQRQAKLDLDYHEDYLRSRNKKQREEADLIHNQKVTEFFKGKCQEIQAFYAKQLNQADLNRLNAAAAAEFASAYASKQQGTLFSEQGKTEFALRAYRKAGLQLDNKEKQIAQEYLGEMMQTGIELNRVHIRQGRQDIENPFRYFGNAILGAGAGTAASYLKPNVSRSVVSGFK